MDRHAGGPQSVRKHRRLPDREGDRVSTAYQSHLELTFAVPARAPFSTVLRQGQELSIVDLGGNLT